MNTRTSPAFIFLAALSLSSGCTHRIADLNMISNRNVEFEKKHVEIVRGISGSHTKLIIFFIPVGWPNIELALDNAVAKQGTGEYMKNATVNYTRLNFILFGLNQITVKGDLMGYEGQKTKKQVRQAGTGTLKKELAPGDRVVFRNKMGKLIQGTVQGINASGAIVEHLNVFGKPAHSKVKFESLTKIE